MCNWKLDCDFEYSRRFRDAVIFLPTLSILCDIWNKTIVLAVLRKHKGIQTMIPGVCTVLCCYVIYFFFYVAHWMLDSKLWPSFVLLWTKTIVRKLLLNNIRRDNGTFHWFVCTTFFITTFVPSKKVVDFLFAISFAIYYTSLPSQSIPLTDNFLIHSGIANGDVGYVVKVEERRFWNKHDHDCRKTFGFGARFLYS